MSLVLSINTLFPGSNPGSPVSPLKQLLSPSLRFEARSPAVRVTVSSPTATLTESIVCAFEQHLRYVSRNDQWAAGGRKVFAAGVAHYVARRQKVEFVLPAFPCKSSNLNKVLGVAPDKGEELALRTLLQFADAVRAVYPPGAKMLVVSDGHVFSDLVGTDDTTVDGYNDALKDMATALDYAGDTFSFAGLDELLSLRDFAPIMAPEELTAGALPTVRTEAAETGRAVLLAALGEPLRTLDMRMKADDALLRLCRGFSRFVLEDTLTHPSLAGLSASKRRRIAWDTGKLMILRNEAYSRLVSVIYPTAVRLSIHPHNNAGPKFAISLLHPKLRAAGMGAPTAGDGLFHIPTPWHNVVLELPGGGYMLAKRNALTALAQSEHQVTLVQPAGPGEGAFYRLAI